jgi:ADP-ribosylglycohydrolase
MFGVAIGDALGAYLMNQRPTIEDITKALLMEGGGTLGLRPGEGTDEWELNVALAEGLLAGKGTYNSNLITAKYLEWIESNPHDMPVIVGIALSKLRQQKHLNPRRRMEHSGNQLARDSLRNSKQESALGMVRLVPLVIWGLNL